MSSSKDLPSQSPTNFPNYANIKGPSVQTHESGGGGGHFSFNTSISSAVLANAQLKIKEKPSILVW